jgi:hypothetical protein
MRSDATVCNTSSAAFSLLAKSRQNIYYKIENKVILEGFNHQKGGEKMFNISRFLDLLVSV